MNLDVQGADIRTVLRSIAEFGKVNIVPDRDIEGPVSVRLVEVPWRQALEFVCESAALTALDRADVIRVATRQVVLEEEIERRSRRAEAGGTPAPGDRDPAGDYANADELTQVGQLRPEQAGKRGSRLPDKLDPRHRLRGAGQADSCRWSATWIRRRPRSRSSAKLVDVDITTARQLGITWSVENLHSDPGRMSGSITNKSR